MAQNNKPLYTLYESLKSDNYDVPDNYDSFERTLTAPGAEGTNSRLALYKSLKDDGYDVPDTYDSFANTLFSAKPRERDVQQQAVNAEAALTPVGNTDPMTIAANFSESSRKMVDDTRRMYEANTPAGRKKQQGLEIAGRMAGRNTRLPGLSVAMPTPEQPEASEGAQAAPKAQDMRGPQYYGTVVDQEDGQTKDQWLMPDGSLTTDFNEADVAAGEARTARLRREFEGRMAVNGLDASKPEDVAAQQAYDRLAQLEARAKMHSDEKLAKLEERYEKAGAMERGQMLIGQNGNTATSMVTMPASVYGNGIYDDEDKLIAAERKNLEDAITAHHAGKLKKTGSFFAAQNLVNAWEGVKDVFKDGDTYTAGMTSMHQSAQMLAIKAKLDKGEALTRGEESLLESMLVKQTIDENVEKPHGYTMGYTIANMVPFMIQMAMNPAAGAGGKLGNMAVKEFAKMMAKRAGQRATKGFMMKAVAKLGKKRAAAIAKGIGVTAGDIVASAGLANTLQAPATMADAALRHAGDVAYDKDGTLHFEGGDGVIKAFAKAEGAMLIEDYTEMLGVHFGVIGGAIGHGTGKAVRRLGGGKLLDNVMKLCANIRATDWAKGIAAIERRAQWNGSVGEVLEEEAGIVLNSIFTGDNSISDLWDKEQQIDIVLGVGAFGAFVSGIKTAGYPIARHKARKALDERAATCEASFGKNWESIRETIDMADEADLAQTIAHLGRRYATTPEKAKALLEYASAMAKARAFNIASASAEELQTTPEQSQIDQSYNNGYTAEGSGRADVQNLYNAQRERALNTLDADTMRNLNADPLATLSGMASAGTYTDEELSVAREYAAAKAAYDGMQQSAEDEIEAQIWRCNAAIDARTNRDTGMVQRATYGLENREVYIIKGNVVADENGVIDRSASDDTIAIVDLETGETKMVASKDLGQAEQPIAAEQFKSSMAAYVRQEIGDRARAQAEGRLLFEENEKCLILDDEGSQSEVTILGGATDEQGAPIAYAVKVQYADGTTGVVAMSELQEQVNAAAAARMDYAEQERQQGAAARAAVDAEVDTDAEQDGLAVEEGGQRRSFALNDEVELIADQGGVTSGMITEIDSDGFIDVQTDKPVNGQTVNHLTLDELMQLLTRHNGEIVDEAEVEAVATAGTPVAPGTKADEADVSDVTDVANVADVAAQSAAPTALERLPKNEKGEPIFENAESPEAAWDALVEFSEGDAATAKEIADAMAEEKRKAYEKVRKQVAKGKTPAELLASKKTIAAALAQAEGEYNMWQQIANVEQRRQDAIRAQQEAEAGQRAAERAEAEKAEREAREEAARLEREALEGIPEWHLDTPENARKRGVRRFSGQMFTRQRPVDGVVGREVEVKFSQSDLPKGRVIVIDASQLQPSHIQGARNPMFFIDEAQPKNRAEAVSKTAAKTMAENIRPQEITGSATAYTGAPTVNPRAEVIQGNNRSDALRYLWDNKLPNQQQAYKQYLIDNAERFSLDPEAIRAMERPVLVNMLDVDDAEAIRLGQMTAQDTESGGVERIKSKNLAQKLGEDMRPFASQLLKSGDEEATFGQLVDRNGAEVLKWMAQKGVITDTQYQSAFDSKGHLTAETKNDLQKVLYQAVFKGGSQQLEEMFEALPAKAQRAILSTAFRDMDSPFAGKMLPEIQASIAAYHQLMRDPAFVASKKLEDLLRAVETFKQVIELDDRFEQYAPADNFSNFALHLAAMYKAGDMSQTTLAGYFNQMYDLAQGKKAATLFEEADTTEYPLADVIKQVLNIDYKPAKNGNNNVANGGADVALRNQDGPGGELRGNEPPASGEQNPAGTKPSDRGAGTVLPVAERGGQGNIHSTQRPEPSNLSQTEAEGIDYEYVLSDEMDQNGRPFVLTSKGDLEFGRIERQSGLAEAPILLSEGIITNPKTKEGYGLIHIEARHGKQIRQNGYANAVEFIEDVANNWEAIMEAKDRNGNPTFRLIAKGKHNNTIMVELSGDGTYWNINTAGIFKTSYGKNAKELYSRHTTDKQSAETVEASQESEHSGTTDSSRMNASATTERKDNDSAPEKQVSGKESSAQTPENEAESGDKTLITEKAYQTIAERVEYSIEIRPNQNGDIFAIRLKKGAKLSEWKNAVGAYGIWSNDGRGEVQFDSFDAMLKYLESRGEEVESLLSKEKWAKREREINDVLFEQTGIREGQTWRGPDGTIVKIGARGFVKGPDGWDFATTVVYPDGRTESTLTPAARISEFFSKHGFESEQTVQTAVEAASAQVNTEPTPAQAEAGNYKKGHVTIGEFDITIENPAGSVRKGVGADGKEWSTQMANAYGYIKGTEGVDGDHIDVFLHSDMDQWNGRKVFVVDQTNTDGSFDEHKVMLGFNDKAEAMTAYLANYDKAWADTHPGLRISETNIEDFNKWVQASHRKTKPFADYTTVRKEATVVIVERGAPEAAKLRQKSSRLEIEGAEKLSAERAEAVERYVEGHYCAPIRVVADEADIRESGLSDVAVAQMMAALTEEDVPAVYCREDKKIYIFAGHKDSNVGSTLAHENFHALADAIGDARERNRMFEAYRKTLLADPKCGVYFKELWDAVINAYAPEEALEDFVGYTINRMYSAPGFIGHLERILDGDVKEYIFNKFINRIFNGTAQESSKPANQQGNSENDGRMAGLLRRGDSAGSAQTEGRAAREETGLHPQLDSRNRREQRGRVSGRGRTAGDSGREADGGADAGLTAAEAAERTQISGEPKGESNNFITPILYGTHTKTDAHRPTNPENRRGGGAGVQQGRAGNSQAEGRADGEESAGEEIANEPRRRYVARKQATTTGMSLFDWADAEERGRREVTTKDEKAIAAEETNAAIDGFVESYSRWLGHSAEIEAQLDAEGVEGELREELTAQMESEETRIAEERDKLEEKLRDYYATDNTPEDATRIARDMVGRVQAEVEIRHRKEHILSDLLNGSDEAPIETTSDEAAAEEKSGEVKTGGGLISYDALGHLPDAKEGEFAYVERKFSRTGEFSFTGADKIRDRGDVAYLFRSLENYSVENVFAVLVKDGKARVLHIGMGTATSSLADMSAIRAGVDAFGADRIYLIHNHPSGTMVASQQDRNLMRTLEAAFGDKIDVSGIIIDTTSGRYVEFDGEGQAEVYDRPRQSDGDKMADVFHFDQADRSNMPEETMAIRSSSDVANAIGNLRFGDGKKVSYLILAHNGHVIGNFHTEYTDINASGLAEELASVASKYGGTSVVVYGNMPLDGVMRLKDAVARHSLGAVRLLDTLGVRNGIRMSAVDEGMLYEDGTPYGPAEVREPMVAARGREAFDALRDRAVAERGIVMPGLNEKVVRVVEVPRHDFNGDKPIAAARRWAKESIVGEHILIDSNGNEVPYTISGKSIDKYLSETAIGKSANIGVHLAALKMLPEIIRESVEVEIHPDYTKDNHASRSAENDINPDNLIHRFYGAALIDGQIHRVKATIIENGVVQKNKPHSYEVTAVELINNAESQPDNHGRIGRPRFSEEQHDVLTSASSRANILGIANLLKGVEKSYDPGKKLLEESEKSELFRRGDERGSFADYSKIKKSVSASSQGSVGRDRFGEKRQAELAARERERMAARIRELAERLHLDNVEVVTDASQLEGVRATAKGFFNKRTGKITIVLPNNLGTIDAEQTLLHEAVAHYGLRKLFGEHFDTFLDNVYESATEEIRHKIAEMAARNGWNFRTATEEYLAGLAENTDFEAISRDAASQSWWAKVKQLFIDMVEKIGFKGFRDKVGVTLTDNELRYILWRSYANLAEPGATRSIFGEAADIAKQAELKVGNYAEGGIEAEYVEPEDVADRIEKLFDAAVAGDLSGGPIEIGRLTPEGRDFLEKLSGKTLKENVSFVLNPSDLVHIYRRHFGANEADSRNTPLTRWDIRQIAEIITSPDKVLYGKEKDGNQRNMFFFLKEAEGGSYNLMEVYADRRGNLTAKSFFKSKEGVSQRAVLLSESSTLTSVTDGATLLDGAKLPKFFDNPIVEEEDLYRPGDFSPRDEAIARWEYERMVSSGGFQFQEAMQDSMLGLKKFYQAILGNDTPIEDVAGFENAYLFENRMSSMNAGEQHEYFRRFMEPLLKEIAKIAGANQRKRKELTDYLMAKHGLERNEHMRNEAAANGENTDRDFAGLIGLTGEADWASAEATAKQWVDDYEKLYNTADLWKAINNATKATLEKVYLSGIISKKTYEEIRDMYEYYIPLRGWNETTSDQVYGYLTSKDGPLGGSIMKKAEGRSSMADDPIATIAMMADDAIRQGNRNLMKQRFLNFVLNHPSDVASVHDIWLEYDDVADEWRPVFADVEATDTAEEVAQKVEAFEQRMEKLKAAHPDKYKKGREAQHIPYKVVKNNLREHQVLIKRNGHTFVVTINGNPRAAQALNGLTNPDVELNNAVGDLLKLATWANRQLSAFYTTRNPDFVVSNFMRDMLYANCMTWVKESPRYALRFHKNFGRVNPVRMRILLGKWESGKLDMSDPIEGMFYQFMLNGGETGYTNVRDIEGHKRAVAAELKKQSNVGRQAWAALGMQLDLLNRSVENCARFAAFVTSREFGRSIDRAIYDAKEVSVNFNKKGSGAKMAKAVGQTWLGKSAAHLGGSCRLVFIFWNAGIQGMANFGRQAKRHPAKFTAGANAMFALGCVIPILAEMMGGGDGDDDDKNAYYNLPEYIRRSNICIRAGEQWISIPLPIEYRAMYGLGEMAYGEISGNEHYSNKELAREMAAQVSQILPIDMLEGGGGLHAFIPSSFKPFTEAYIMNEGWTGLPVYKDNAFNKNDPEWTKAYASADKHLVDFTRWLNETTGGNDYKKGEIDINPAKLEYLLSGTFGGLFTFPNKVKKAGETAFGDREFEWRNMPIANRLIKSGDERTAYRKLQNEYYKYLEEYKETKRLYRKYEKADESGVLGYAERLDFLENSPEFLRAEIFDDFKDIIDANNKALQDGPDDEIRAEIEAEQLADKRELVNALNDPEAYFRSLREAGMLSDDYMNYLERNFGMKLRTQGQ